MIEVHIAKDMLDARGHESLVGERMVKCLKEAGVPTLGYFALRGVSKGTLIYHNEEDLNGDVHVFRWREDDDDRETKFVRGNLSNGSIVFKSGRHAAEDEEL